jgi:hypothetical protein
MPSTVQSLHFIVAEEGILYIQIHFFTHPSPKFTLKYLSFMDKDNPFRERELCLAIQLTKKPHFFKKNSKQ